MWQKWIIIAALLVGAVPAGCLPIVTIGGIVEEVRAIRNPPRGRHPSAATNGWIFAAVATVLSAVVILLFRRQLRRTRDPRSYPLGLGADTYRVILWVAFALGVGCGLFMVFTTSGLT